MVNILGHSDAYSKPLIISSSNNKLMDSQIISRFFQDLDKNHILSKYLSITSFPLCLYWKFGNSLVRNDFTSTEAMNANT